MLGLLLGTHGNHCVVPLVSIPRESGFCKAHWLLDVFESSIDTFFKICNSRLVNGVLTVSCRALLRLPNDCSEIMDDRSVVSLSLYAAIKYKARLSGNFVDEIRRRSCKASLGSTLLGISFFQ